MLSKLIPRSIKHFSPKALNSRKLPLSRNYTSALYIPGSKASETFSYLTPYLDYTKTFSQLDELQRNLHLRGINVNAEDIKSTWDFHLQIDGDRKTIESKRSSLAHRMKILSKLKDPKPEDKTEMEGLITQGKVLRQDLRAIKEILWDLEETVIPRVLQLPNDLHERTPEALEVVMKTVGTKIPQNPAASLRNHLEIGNSLGLLEYLNEFHFYLSDEAALFEVAVQAYAAKVLNDEGIFRVAGTDFAKSLLVEGAGLDHEDPFSTLTLMNDEDGEKNSGNRLHLVGGASLVSFLAMHTKQLVNPKHFPLRYFATGRSYTPAGQKPMDLGLFGVCQTSAVHCMSAVPKVESHEYEEEFQRLVDTVSKIYEGLGVHYRIVLRHAGQLEPAECLRVGFELWSNYYDDYVEVGHVSMYGDYLAKRLLIAYQTPTGRGHPAIVSGTVLNVNRMLACLLEENAEKFQVPEAVREFMPIGEV